MPFLVPSYCLSQPDGNLKCYRTFTDPVTFDEAKVKCQDWNSILAEPKTADELEFIFKTFVKDKNHVWIGVEDLVTEGR